MTKYRKRPILVDAFQMTLLRRWDNQDWPNWLHEAWNRGSGECNALFIDPLDSSKNQLILNTRFEGTRIVPWDDWIIRDVTGNLHLCKGALFPILYEKIEE